MEAIVLAGGLGTRLRTVVSDVPKPMAPINGRPFLDHLLDYWITQGVTRVIFAVSYKADLIQKHFGLSYQGIALDYSIETAPLGTGGGLLLAVSRLHEAGPFLVMNGDTFFAVNLEGLSAHHRSKSAKVTMALTEVSKNSRYHGVVLDDDSRIIRLEGGKAHVLRCYINGGVYLINKDALDIVRPKAGEKSSLENDLLPSLLAAQIMVYGYVSAGRFVDIGIPEDYAAAGSVLAGR